MKDFLVDIFTGVDGVSFDLGRVSWAITTIAITALAVYMIHVEYSMSIAEFGGALAANSAAHGAAIKMKQNTEPQA